MTDRIFALFLVLSVTVLVCSVIMAIRSAQRIRQGIFSGLHLLTFGVFFACILMFIPVNFVRASVEQGSSGSSPILVALYNSLQVFFLNAEYHVLISDLPIRGITQFCYGAYLALLFAVAPLLTFVNILSLFKNLAGKLKLKLMFWRPLYIFSELNDRSVTMAHSIIRRSPRSLIVYCDVMRDEDDDHAYELLQKARELRAIVLKDDITRLHLRRKTPVEAFLIGENESKNIEQATRLTDEYREYDNRCIYVFSSRPAAGYIFDSLIKGKNMISSATMEGIRRDPDSFIENVERAQENCSVVDGLYLRRIDVSDLLTYRILTDDDLLHTLFDDTNTERKISLVIVGLGGFGGALLRTALWLYQVYGYRLSIDVIEAGEQADVEKRLLRDIPSLEDFRTDDDCLRYVCDDEGDSNFDLRIHCGVDCDTADLPALFKREADDLRGAQAVFVTLGDDDRNIEAAIMLRRIYDRINCVNEYDVRDNQNELPLIFSVVYDNRKASNLTSGGEYGISDYRGVSFHVRFVGSMSEQYDYRVIEDLKETEERALQNHFDWIRSTILLHRLYDMAPASGDPDLIGFHRLLKEFFAKCFDDGQPRWYDDDMYLPDGSINPERIIDEVANYAQFEYFRNSSIAKARHGKMIEKYLTDYFDSAFDHSRHRPDLLVCGCDRCNYRRITEHMRWNAYMQSIGNLRAKKRSARAMTHNDIVPWDRLYLPECYKD